MIGMHHQLDGHEFDQTLGVGHRQGCLVCCSPRGHKELDMTERLNNSNEIIGELRNWNPGMKAESEDIER